MQVLPGVSFSRFQTRIVLSYEHDTSFDVSARAISLTIPLCPNKTFTHCMVFKHHIRIVWSLEHVIILSEFQTITRWTDSVCPFKDLRVTECKSTTYTLSLSLVEHVISVDSFKTATSVKGDPSMHMNLNVGFGKLS